MPSFLANGGLDGAALLRSPMAGYHTRTAWFLGETSDGP
jgi:hypothetical protein